jgi:hypothetical protein
MAIKGRAEYSIKKRNSALLVTEHRGSGREWRFRKGAVMWSSKF